MNEKQSECDTSVNLEDADITSVNDQMDSENSIDESVEKLNRSEKDYSGIIIDIVE